MLNNHKNNYINNEYILVTPTYSMSKSKEDLLNIYKRGLLQNYTINVDIEYLQGDNTIYEELTLSDFINRMRRCFKNHIILTRDCLNTQLLCTSLSLDNRVLGMDLLYHMFRRDYGLKEIIAFLINTGSSVASMYTDVVTSSLQRFKNDEITTSDLMKLVSFSDYLQAIEQLYVTGHR